MKTAIVIGATGLVGSDLVRQLLEHPEFGKVAVLVRRPTGITNNKLSEHVVDFDRSDEWQQLVAGDVLFSALGTTIRKAGSKDAQWKIDYTYQLRMAQVAAGNGVPVFILVSSAGASVDSKIFYSRMKGELEREVKRLPFRKTVILRPGILDGAREESRPAEAVAIRMMRFISSAGFLRKYRPVPASTVARAMINASLNTDSGVKEHELEGVFDLGKY